MMQQLKLTSKEVTPRVLDDEGDEDLPGPEWALIGKVLAPSSLHVETIKAVVRPAWGNPKGLIVRPMGPNLFMAEFGSESDMGKVAKGGPWRLGKHAILLKRFDVTIKPEDMIFDELKVWARIMNLGFELMNTERGTPLAARLGTVERFDVDDKGKAWGSILRARITIKPMEPIMRCVSVFSRKRQMMMHFDVMYERLPKFCFSCGLIGHSLITCLNPADHDGEGKLPYNGDRLCVPEKRSALEQTQSTRSSRKQSEMGPNSQASGMDAGKQKDSGEVSSPAKKSARARKQSNPQEKTAVTPGGGKLAVSPMISGQKRKSKQVYFPKLVNV
jgi:hypothetical protein